MLRNVFFLEKQNIHSQDYSNPATGRSLIRLTNVAKIHSIDCLTDLLI